MQGILTLILQVSNLMYVSGCALYYIYMHTLGVCVPRVWLTLINSIDLIGQLIIYVLNIYILHMFKPL